MTGTERSRFRVTIGIPLYRARPFVDRITRNVAGVVDRDVEFLLADQHCLDDALEVLTERLRGDPRVRFFASRDGLSWIGNYNFLLRHASGDYFRILTQDDVLAGESLAAAREFLDADPETVLVVGPEELIDVAGGVFAGACRSRRALAAEPSRNPRLDALRLVSGWRYPTANLGLVRRASAVREGLVIPWTYGETGLSVRAWLFAVSLRGRIREVPEYLSRRCVHADSFTSRHLQRSPLHLLRRLLSYFRVTLAAWKAGTAGALARLAGVPILFGAACLLYPAARVAFFFGGMAEMRRR